jgi:hypothetical protein
VGARKPPQKSQDQAARKRKFYLKLTDITFQPFSILFEPLFDDL